MDRQASAAWLSSLRPAAWAGLGGPAAAACDAGPPATTPHPDASATPDMTSPTTTAVVMSRSAAGSVPGDIPLAGRDRSSISGSRDPVADGGRTARLGRY